MRFPGPVLAWSLALAGLALLLGATLASEAPTVALSELPAHDGGRVTLTGRVLQAGGSPERPLLVVTDGAYQVRVWLSGPGPAAGRGDEVQVTGRVTVDRGDFTLDTDERDVRVLSRAADVVLRPAELAESPQRHAGTPLRVEGKLLRESGVWWLRDLWANRAVRVEGDVAWQQEAGEAWGTLRYAPQRAGYVLEVHAWTPQPSLSP